MTKQEISAAVASMQRKPVSNYWTSPIKQLPNGKWHHRYDAKREWTERDGCETDYRFTCDHYASRGAL